MTASAAGEDYQRGGSRRRSVARLTAVQALYQLEANPEAEPEAVVREFVRHRFGREIDGDQLGVADPALFGDIVRGTAADREQLDAEISAALTPDWPLARLDAVLRAILRAGAYELVHRPDVPPRVAISEYTAVAYAFFTGKEPGLANGVLDRLARTPEDWRGLVAMAGEALGEFERIRRFYAPLAGPGGLGLLDDAALVDCRGGRRLVVTADAIVEGVHYLPDDPPDLVARKLLRINLSDLAAMAARPLHYLLTTALPATLDAEWLAGFAEGLGEDQRRFGVDLLGGDSVATPGPASLSLTAIGEVEAGMEVRRSGARPGDLVWVSGTIGDAFLGLGALGGAYPELAPEHRAALIARFQIPDPRVELGPLLAGLARAMIDVSDGLLADLGHICETSHVAAIVELGRLPLSPAARLVVAAEPGVCSRLVAAGDDYELLFAAPADAAEHIVALSSQLDVPITMIGRIEAGAGVRLVDAAGQIIPVEAVGYQHF